MKQVREATVGGDDKSLPDAVISKSAASADALTLYTVHYSLYDRLLLQTFNLLAHSLEHEPGPVKLVLTFDYEAKLCYYTSFDNKCQILQKLLVKLAWF